MKEIFLCIAYILSACAVAFWLNFFHLQQTQFFAPKYEAVRRQTFEQSKAYQQGVVQELQNMQFEYIKANPEQKIALASIIKHRAAGVDPSILPNDLYVFIKGL